MIMEKNDQQYDVKHKSHGDALYIAVKRMLDIIISGIALVILSPLFLVIAVLIKLEDGGPIIHHRKCIRLNGFYDMPKFRTMVLDADNLEKYFTPEQIVQYQKNIKLDNDPRITRIGNYLRKTSLDELMQLVAIFKGDMSVVGPRPMVEAEGKHFGDRLPLILQAKPGLTGYWQTHGRSDCTYESGKRQELELYYVNHRSLFLDIKIFFLTFVVVLTGKGAK